MHKSEKQDALSNQAAEHNRKWKAQAEQIRIGLESTVNRVFSKPYVTINVAEVYQNGLIVGLNYSVEGTVRNGK